MLLFFKFCFGWPMVVYPFLVFKYFVINIFVFMLSWFLFVKKMFCWFFAFCCRTILLLLFQIWFFHLIWNFLGSYWIFLSHCKSFYLLWSNIMFTWILFQAFILFVWETVYAIHFILKKYIYYIHFSISQQRCAGLFSWLDFCEIQLLWKIVFSFFEV